MGGGKGGGGSSQAARNPTKAETAQTQASTNLTNISAAELQAGGPLRRLLQSLGMSAAASGSPTDNQLPSLQRQLNVMKQANAARRAQVLQQLGTSRQVNTPFGQSILAGVTGQSGLQEASLIDNAVNQQIALGLNASGQSAQIGVGGSQAANQGFGNVMSSQGNRDSMLYGQQGANATALGSGIGSLAGLATAAYIFGSHPDLKTDITPASDEQALADFRKQPIYHWRYKWEKKKRVGGMTPDMPDDVIVGDLEERIGYDPISYLGKLAGAVRALDKRTRRQPKRRRA